MSYSVAMSITGRERTTDSGIPVKPVYRPEDAGEPRPDPGAYPYTRGVRADGYRERPWTMRQYAGFSTAAESNRRYHQLIHNGTTGLSVAFDLPTQMGYDSDAAVSHGEVGKVGVAIDSLQDMRTLFDGIPLGEVSTSMTINAPAAVLLDGARRARAIAGETMTVVRDRCGLPPVA